MKDKVVCKCYGKEKEFNSREEAKKFYWEGALCSEGSEQSRYINILADLDAGKKYCTDGE